MTGRPKGRAILLILDTQCVPGEEGFELSLYFEDIPRLWA